MHKYNLIVVLLVFGVLTCASFKPTDQSGASSLVSDKGIIKILEDDDCIKKDKVKQGIIQKLYADIDTAAAVQVALQKKVADLEKELRDCEKKLVESSEKAGAGKFVYFAMFFAIGAAVFWIAMKVLGKFGIL